MNIKAKSITCTYVPITFQWEFIWDTDDTRAGYEFAEATSVKRF